MGDPQNWLHPQRQSKNLFRHHENLSHTSPTSKKPQNFLSSVKGLVQRNSRGMSDYRPTRSAQDLNITHPHWHPRSRSLNSVEAPSSWKQRGQTPGMDDYLTLAELENIWITQDSYVGSVQAPQGSKKYTYVEPVEAPTIVKHQLMPESTRKPLPQLRITTEHSQPPVHGPSHKSENIGIGDEVPYTALEQGRSPNSRWWRTHSSAEQSPDTPSPPPIKEVRNAVVSGIVHPAFRPQPYFDSPDISPSCRLTGRLTGDIPSSNRVYGMI